MEILGYSPRLKALSPRGAELFFTLLFGCLIGWQLFVPPVIGSADNGDFPKIAGRFCIGVADYQAFVHKYFQPAYVRDPAYCWDSEIPSSELAPAWIAVPVGVWLGGGKHFDLRWMAAVQASLLLGSFWLLLRAVRPLELWRRAVFAVFALWIFADPSYVSYMSSFYTDTMALVGLLVMVSSAVWLAQRPRSLLPLLLSGLGSIVFVTSKAQHAIWGVPIAVCAFVIGRRYGPGLCRRTTVGGGVLLILATIWILAGTPRYYVLNAQFNVIFFRVAKEAPQAEVALAELGLDQDYLRFVGMHAFMPGSPTQTQNGRWIEQFRDRTGWRQLAGYYLRHPIQTAHILRSVLGFEARYIQTTPNYRVEDGFPPGALATGSASWSNLRGRLFALWPWHIVVWLGGVALLCVGTVVRRPANTAARLASICLAVVVLAAGEYLVACLADATDTFRHLFMFHTLTDLTILFALGSVLATQFGRCVGAECQASSAENGRAP